MDLKERQAREWIEDVVGIKFHQRFDDMLRDGVILCILVNRIRPNTIPNIYRGNKPYQQMENVSAFINACRLAGVRENDLFTTVDLYESKDVGQVIITIHAFARVVEQHGFTGPKIRSSDGVTLGRQVRKPTPSHQQYIAPNTVDRSPMSNYGVARTFPWESKPSSRQSNQTYGASELQRENTHTPRPSPSQQVYSETQNATARSAQPSLFTVTPKTVSGSSSSSGGNSYRRAQYQPRTTGQNMNSGTSVRGLKTQFNNSNRNTQKQKEAEQHHLRTSGQNVNWDRFQRRPDAPPTGHRARSPEERKQVNWARFR